jgi:hypothetical protein
LSTSLNFSPAFEVGGKCTRSSCGIGHGSSKLIIQRVKMFKKKGESSPRTDEKKLLLT